MLHKHPPFKNMKPPYKHEVDSFFLDRVDEIELAYHPFDLPMKGWWSNKWSPEEGSNISQDNSR